MENAVTHEIHGKLGGHLIDATDSGKPAIYNRRTNYLPPKTPLVIKEGVEVAVKGEKGIVGNVKIGKGLSLQQKINSAMGESAIAGGVAIAEVTLQNGDTVIVGDSRDSFAPWAKVKNAR